MNLCAAVITLGITLILCIYSHSRGGKVRILNCLKRGLHILWVKSSVIDFFLINNFLTSE